LHGVELLKASARRRDERKEREASVQTRRAEAVHKVDLRLLPLRRFGFVGALAVGFFGLKLGEQAFCGRIEVRFIRVLGTYKFKLSTQLRVI
jgi:hypothetical protein